MLSELSDKVFEVGSAALAPVARSSAALAPVARSSDLIWNKGSSDVVILEASCSDLWSDNNGSSEGELLELLQCCSNWPTKSSIVELELDEFGLGVLVLSLSSSSSEWGGLSVLPSTSTTLPRPWLSLMAFDSDSAFAYSKDFSIASSWRSTSFLAILGVGTRLRGSGCMAVIGRRELGDREFEPGDWDFGL